MPKEQSKEPAKDSAKKPVEKVKPTGPASPAPKPKKDKAAEGADLERYLSKNGHYFVLAEAISDYKSQKGQPGFDPNEVAAKLYKPFIYLNRKFPGEMEDLINKQFGVLVQNNAVTESYLSRLVDRVEPLLGKSRDELLGVLPNDLYKQLAFIVLKEKEKRPKLAQKILSNPSMTRPANLLQLLGNVNTNDELTDEVTGKFYDHISSNNPADYVKSGILNEEQARSYIEKGRALFVEGMKALKNTNAKDGMKQILVGTTAKQIDYEMKKMDSSHIQKSLREADPVEVMSLVYHGLAQKPAEQSANEQRQELGTSLPGEPV